MKNLRQEIEEIVKTTPVFDMHTHLSPSEFGELCLWGIDELVRYHYLIAELFRSSPVTPAEYWAMSKEAQADLIWDTLFVRNTPLSEAARGVVCVLSELGLDPGAPDLKQARRYFASADVKKHIDRVFQIANVSQVVMTNDAFSDVEAPYWRSGVDRDPRFHAALRMDPLLNSSDGVKERLGGLSARKFLDGWIERMKPLYMAVSLPSSFVYPDNSSRTGILRQVVLPAAREHNLPFAMMIGVKRQINPLLRDAGDGVAQCDIGSVEELCRENPDVRFLVSVLSRENQHELCVLARKFANLMPFGCWWFLNNPSIISEITSERVEMLGATFIPQHSDARILDQLIYKWIHSRRVITDVLHASYSELVRDGFKLTREHIQRDVTRMLSGNFEAWIKRN